MSENRDKPESVEAETLPKKMRRWSSVLQATEIIAALLSTIAAILANVSIEVLSSRVAPRIPASLTIVLPVSAGIIIIAFVAVNLYQRQTRQRQFAREKLREKEKAFFARIENDISALLAEEVQ